MTINPSSASAAAPGDHHGVGVCAHDFKSMNNVGASKTEGHSPICWHFDWVRAEGEHSGDSCHKDAAIGPQGDGRMAELRVVAQRCRINGLHVTGRTNWVANSCQKNGPEKKREQRNCRPHPDLLVEFNIHEFATSCSGMRSAALEKQKHIHRQPSQHEKRAKHEHDGKRTSRMTEVLVVIFDARVFR